MVQNVKEVRKFWEKMGRGYDHLGEGVGRWEHFYEKSMWVVVRDTHTHIHTHTHTHTQTHTQKVTDTPPRNHQNESCPNTLSI